MSFRRLWVLAYVCLVSSLVTLIFNPARPLWPAGWTHETLAASPRFAKLADRMKPYILFPERAHTGESIVRAIPENERQIVVLIGDDRPLLPLFYPYSLGRKVVLLLPQATPDDLNKTRINYVVAGGASEETYPELCHYLEQSSDYTLVLSTEYVSKLSRGPETWKLYRRKSVATTEVPAP
jgi:hypothetical protein